MGPQAVNLVVADNSVPRLYPSLPRSLNMDSASKCEFSATKGNKSLCQGYEGGAQIFLNIICDISFL